MLKNPFSEVDPLSMPVTGVIEMDDEPKTNIKKKISRN